MAAKGRLMRGCPNKCGTDWASLTACCRRLSVKEGASFLDYGLLDVDADWRIGAVAHPGPAA